MPIALILLLAAAATFLPAQAQTTTNTAGATSDGARVFQEKCAVCHRPASGTRAPLPEALHQMTRKSIRGALETGKMREQGSKLTAAELSAVVEYLGPPDTAEPALPSLAFCSSHDPSGSPPLSFDPASPGWNGWGVDLANSRFQAAEAAGLDRQQVPRLKLKWAFGFPGASWAPAQPTIASGRLFLGSEDGTVYSLDAQTGCIYWTFKVPSTVRAAVSVDSKAAYFGDTQANVYAVATLNGRLLWQTQVDSHPQARITGAPKLYKGRLYVPVSSGEEGSAQDSKYECCIFRGSVVALDTRTGKQVWKAYAIPDAPKITGKNAAGARTWGPSGAAIWSSPTLDLERRAVYVGTGNSYSGPPSPFSDAVVAFDMDSGKMLWSQQLTSRDIWNLACVIPDKTGCPKDPGDDVDIGTSPILRQLPNGKRLLIVGQKSGVVHALDPDRSGKVVWQTRIGRGGLLGGIEWGGAADEKVVYFPRSDFSEAKPEEGGGMFALGLLTGEKIWYTPAPRPACLGRPGCSAAQLAPATLIPGVVFSGSLDGHLRAYDTATGAMIWDLDTLKDFATVNGVKAHGGAMSAIGPTIAAGMLYVESGYAGQGISPGNVLLAFSADGK